MPLSGLAASKGRATGRVRVLHSRSEGDSLRDGEVLAAAITSPDWVPSVRRAAALVTDGGGMTCHAAIVSRELGVPCVVGTRNATTMLRDGELVTVAGSLGEVFQGSLGTLANLESPQSSQAKMARLTSGPQQSKRGQALATRLYVNLAVAEHAEEVAAMDVAGVGFLCAEFMVADTSGGVHPR